MKTQTEQFKRKRKFLLVLPLLALPFITLAFWALGGGKGDPLVVDQNQGFNKVLPEAKASLNATDKMSLYNQADKDSIALQEQLRADPYAIRDTQSMYAANPYDNSQFQTQVNPTGGYMGGRYSDANEEKVSSRLAQLDRVLRQPVSDEYQSVGNSSSNGNYDLEQLQRMMQSVQNGNAGDPEMQQLDGMLEKLLDLQNPARAQQKLREQSQLNKGRVYAVSKFSASTATDVMESSDTHPIKGKFAQALITNGNGFYDIEPAPSSEDTVMQTAIAAVINETQTLVSGATVKMRLTEDVFINGVKIPSGTFVSGNCSVDGERLKIEVTGLRYGRNLFPVTLSAYDLDAIEGVRIPGAISRDASKDGADRAIQGVQLMSLDPSIGAQAASAGVEAAKGLFSKKVKLIRVTVKAGHPLLLLDAKTKQGLN